MDLLSHSDPIQAMVRHARHVFLALDFDGVLAPIAPRPEQAEILPTNAGSLRSLHRLHSASVAVISGRSVGDLREKIGLDVIYAGDHGMTIEGQGFSFRHATASSLHMMLEQACWELREHLHSVPGVIVERKELSATVHYRQAPAPLSGWIGSAVLRAMEPYRGSLAVSRARKAWEIRYRVDWNKGSALKHILQRLDPDSVVVCAGDDATDEDMFEAAPEAISIKVGHGGRTNARYRVSGPEDFAVFLAQLSRVLCTREAAPLSLAAWKPPVSAA